MSGATEEARAALGAWLESTGVEHWAGARPGEVVVRLPGERRLHTTVSLLLGEHTLGLSAFVVRRPEENHDAVMRWLLRRNARLPGIAFAIDGDGDVYLVGRLPVTAVSDRTLDALLGAVLHTADTAFDELLKLGYASAIRREARWRHSRGLGTANLAAFAELLTPEATEPAPETAAEPAPETAAEPAGSAERGSAQGAADRAAAVGEDDRPPGTPGRPA